MKKIIFFIILIYFSILNNLFPNTFKWDMKENDRLEMVKSAKIMFILNSKLGKEYEERNIIDLTCYKKDEKGNYVKGSFSVYTKDKESTVYRLEEKQFSDFLISYNGKFNVPEKFYMPNLRHLPSFPSKDLNEGDSWTGVGEMIIANFSIPFSLQMPVNYQLASIEEKNGKKTAVINYKFVINHNLTNQKVPDDFPSLISGKDSGMIYWDLDKNQPSGQYDNYTMIFLFGTEKTGFKTYEWRMDIDSTYRIFPPVTNDDKEKDKAEIIKKLPKDVTVETNKNGIIFRLGEFLFDFNSAQLKEETKSTLDSVISIIKEKYPDSEIIVEGHTDNTGNREYNYSLSEKRARAIAEKIRPNLNHDKLSYKGYGEDRPLNSNKTEEERKKNRRVEVIIKLN